MRAQIKVHSFDSSIWGGFEGTDHQETTYVLEEGESICTIGLGATYCLKIVGVRPGSVEVLVSPDLVLLSSGQGRSAGPLTLDVGDTARLQTLSFDAWGNWEVSLQSIL